MLSGMSLGATAPASAAPYGSYPSGQMGYHSTHKLVHHPKHRHKHLWCKTFWRHHHQVKICVWVPNKHY